MSGGRTYYSEETADEDSQLEDLENQLFHFSHSGQHERVLHTGAELLAQDPENAWCYEIMGDAAIGIGDYPQAEALLRNAVALAPESASIAVSQCRLEMARNRMGTAEDHIRRAIQLEPMDAVSWYLFGVLSVHFENPKQARFCESKVRELAPESDLADTLKVDILTNQDGKDSLSPDEKIRELTSLLKNNPESDLTHYKIAHIYLAELNDPSKAEEHFLHALKLDPQDKDYQSGLIKSWRKRQIGLILLWLPYRPIHWLIKLCAWCDRSSWRYLLLVPVFKYLLAILIVSAMIFYPIFWPIAKLYEYLTLAEAHKNLGMLKLYSSPMERIHRMPRIKRLAIFFGLTFLYWMLLLFLPGFLIDNNMIETVIKSIFGFLFASTVLFCIYVTIKDEIQKRRRNTKNKQLNTVQ